MATNTGATGKEKVLSFFIVEKRILIKVKKIFRRFLDLILEIPAICSFWGHF